MDEFERENMEAQDPYEAAAPKEDAVEETKAEETKPKDPVDAAMEKAFADPPEAPEVTNEEILREIGEVKKDLGAVLDAAKEIAKSSGEIAKNVALWRKAGKF